jgi:hypothetical protein
VVLIFPKPFTVSLGDHGTPQWYTASCLGRQPAN